MPIYHKQVTNCGVDTRVTLWERDLATRTLSILPWIIQRINIAFLHDDVAVNQFEEFIDSDLVVQDPDLSGIIE